MGPCRHILQPSAESGKILLLGYPPTHQRTFNGKIFKRTLYVYDTILPTLHQRFIGYTFQISRYAYTFFALNI